MTRYVARRLLITVPVLVLVSIIAFSLVLLLPGDPALAMLGEDMAKNEELYQTLRHELGLDRPIPVQYLFWARRAIQGDLGTSLRTGEPVAQAVLRRLAPTLQLASLSLVLSLAIGIPAGLLSALRPNSWQDAAGSVLALAGVAIPNFWLGILLIMLFALWLRWLPPSGYMSPSQDWWAWLRLMAMPALALSTGLAGTLMRQMRSQLLEVMGEEYIRTARAKGLRERLIVVRHALKNALIPIVTILGMHIGHLFGGTATLEIVFAIPGMGRLAVDSIFFRDFPVLQGAILVIALAVLLSNLLADLLYGALDPRIRYS